MSEHLENPQTSDGENVATLVPLFFFIGFSFLQVRRTTIKSWMSSKFSPNSQLTAELAVLECLSLGSNMDNLNILDKLEFVSFDIRLQRWLPLETIT